MGTLVITSEICELFSLGLANFQTKLCSKHSLLKLDARLLLLVLRFLKWYINTAEIVFPESIENFFPQLSLGAPF